VGGGVWDWCGDLLDIAAGSQHSDANCFPELELTRCVNEKERDEHRDEVLCCAQLLAAFSVLPFIQAKGKHAERRAQLPIVPSHDPSIMLNYLD
jgi:hypothetical protein